MKNFNLIEMLRGCSKRSGTTFRQSNPDGQPTVNRQSRLMSHRGYLKNLAMIFAVLVMSVANVGTAWGASVAEGTYNFVDQTIGAVTKFYKIDNGIYQYRLNAYTRNSSVGIQLPASGDGTGFVFHLESPQKVYIGIVKKSVKREVTNNLYIKTITEANFSAIEAGSNNSTTVTLTLGGSATLSGNYTFAAIGSAKTEGATVYMGELPAGYYYAYGNSSNSEGNLYSITFGTQTLFLVPNDKTASSAKFSIYYWMGGSGYERQGWSDYMTVSPCNSSTYRADIPKGYTKVIFVRLDPSGGRNWDSKWNQTGNLTFDGSKDLFTWANGSWDGVTTTWSASTKYTISFAANGGSGSMSNVSSIACGRSVKLAANAYEKSGYTFAGWKTNVAVTANGSAVAANGIVADGATISNITSNITLTAQWNEDVTCTATQPGALSKGTLSGCSRTITASGAAATNNTWYWQNSASGTDKSDAYSSGKAITEAGTYYLRSFCSDGSGCWSDAVQVTITAADMTPAAPTALAKSSVTAKGVTLTVTDAANTNDYEFYVNTSSSAPSAGTSASYTSTSKSVTITDKYAGTTFYAWARAKCGSNKSAWTALGDGGTFTTSTVTVTHTLTNVTETSSAATSGVGGSDYEAVYEADEDYALPTPVVTIGGNTATSGTDYTWNAGTGTITIPANKINGNIVITLNSAASAPSSAVISGTYHYFPGENISLTVTPSGNNGPTTYQWYKGGKSDEDNLIDGATSATYTKNSCAFADAGSYYCKVTCNETSIWANTNSYENYDVKILRLYVNGSKSGEPYGNVDFTKVDGTTATASIALGSGWTYGFNIADGCGHYYGNAGTMQENNCTNWTTNVNGTDCGLTTTNAATYIFTINYSSLEAIVTSVTYPVGNQAADKVIYFDNNDRAWTSVYYRIGKSTHSQASVMTKVYGTANLYQFTTTEYNGFSGWHIANATGDVGSGKSIYKTVDGTPITEATAHEGASVTATAVTVTPTSSKGMGSDVGVNDNCEFYNYTITDGMKTDRVTITEPSNGTIMVNYTNTSNVASTLTSGYADLAHTVILTSITATPNTGYDAGAITINGGAYSANHVVTGATTIAASFTPQTYSITYKDQGNVAFSGTHTDTPSAHPISHTYNTATNLNGATKAGYTFGGWYTESDCSSGLVTTLGATAYTANITLYAKWTEDEPAGEDCIEWAGTPSSWTEGKMTISSKLVLEADPSDATKTAINTDQKVWGDSHTETVIAISGTDNYIQGYFNDGSEISTITISAANNNGTASTDKNYLVLFCANSSFSTGVTGQLHAAPSYKDAKNDSKLVHEFTAPAGTKYFRIYRKISSDVGDYSTSSGAGDGQTTRIYHIEVCSGDTPEPAGDEHVYYYKDATHYVSSTYKNPEGNTPGGSDGDNVALTTPWTIRNSTFMTGLTSVVATAARYDNKGNHMNAYIKLRQTDGGKIVFTIASGYTATIKIKMGGYDAKNENITMKLNDSGDNIAYSGTMSGAGTTENNYAQLTYADLAAGAYTLKPTSGSLYISQIDIETEAVATDETAPTLSSSVPDNGATSVATSGNITLTFSENVTIVDASKFSLSGGTGTLNTASASASGAVVTIPYSGLANSTTYTLSTAAGAVEDAAGNDNAALSSISFTTEAAAATYTVTYNAQGGSVTPSSETVSTATLPTPTKSGYTFDGWYTSGGSKITGTYNPTADITLYAQWRENCVGTATTLEDINFKDAAWSDKTFNQANTNDEDEINGVYFWAKDATKHFSLEDNTSNGLTFPNNNMSSGTYYFCIPITGINSSNKQITVTLKHGYSSAQAEYKWAYVDGRTSFSDGNTGGSGGTKVQDASKASTEITFTLNNSGKGLTNTDGHLFIGRSSSSYTNIYGVTVTTPGAAGTCYYVTYNGNGATGGYTTDEAAYASGDEATAATNSFTKTGYTFGGWATSKANADAGTKTYDEGADISITGNITLYAIWQAAGYTLAWDSNDGSALSGDYSSGSISDGATITAPNDPTRANYTFDSWNTAADGSGSAYTGTMPAANTTYYAVWKNTLTLNTGSQGSESNKSPTVFLDGSSLNGFSAHKAAGYTLQGYYTAATGGTKVLNADGSFAASNIARFVTSGKWSRTTGDTILVAQWESSYLLKWNLQLNKEEDAISTTSKESATARVTTASMTSLTNNGELTITGSKKSDLTSKIETPIDLSGAESKYMSVSFDVTAGYQLLPSAVKVMVQPVGDGENKYAKLILEDENSHSISTVVTCEGTEKGKKTTVTLSNAGGTVFTGTVTLKILVYNASGASTTNNCYRLGSPIQIDGAIEAACDLPSYEGLEYDQTEYTVGVDEASAIRVTGGSADTYQWKWNSTNDRSTGTVVGTNNASYTPLITISEVGTRYYWCELKNDDCDGVVKTPVVAVTVSSAVTATTVTWSDPENEPNYGGGGYVIRATVDQTEWGGTLGESNLVAPAGIHITNVATGTDDGKQYIEATFDVTTAFDRDENEVIVFGLTHDAVTGYSAISVTDTIDYDACSGGEEGSAAIALTSAIHDEGSGNAPRYWFETIGVGRVFGLNYGKATLGTSSDDTFNTDGYSYVASSTSQRWVFQPYVEGVTKIRIYIKSATNTLRVLSIGKNASWQDQSSKYSNIAVDTIIYSNGKTTGLDNNQKGYAEIQFSSALTKDNYYMFTMSSSSTYIYGVTLYSGSVGDGGNLATSLTFANTGPIDADASTANFQNIASKSGENSNTLGTITYSSNNDAATVNATTGEVSIHAKETAQVVTITATLSASGCYQGATATYTINVAADACDEPSGSIELTSGSATKCSGESVILTMTGFASGATVEWYNGDTKVNGESGYTIVTSGSTSTLETSNAGTYSAIAKVDGGCQSGAGRTNSITISNIAVDASATKIVDKWYVKNGRLTPDIALWQLSEGATLDEVTIVRNVSGEGSLGLTSSDFVARDGIVYLSGKEPSANETGADIEYTLTLTVKDACDGEHEMTEKTITLTHQKNTDKHVLAFVVNGTAKGGFTDGITAAQTTSVGLYNAIAAQFDVLATNIYATDDEKKLKEYYSQFDILCITDYPNTQTKGANSKSYVDAIGALIDIRPILTMEAFVSSLPNWKLKGVSGNPKSPSTRQYTMLLQCKDHEIFSGTKLTKVGEGLDALYRVTMVDKNQEEYKTLDANYGDGEHKANEGYQYGKKPALQGFTYTEEMSDNNMLPLGLIDDGAGNNLQVGIERQTEMEARMMVLGINSYAMERLDKDGQAIVINALKYLMKKSAEDISDCSVYFDGSDETDPKNWDNELNWGPSYASLPLPHQEVRILKECVVKDGVVARASGIKIIPSGRINHDTDDASGSLTIEPGGALIVDGKVRAAVAPNYFNATPTTPSNLVLQSNFSAQAALILDNSEGETQATVQMWNPSYWEVVDGKKKKYWSYVAVPIQEADIPNFFWHGFTYLYDETSGWIKKGDGTSLYPFQGIGASLQTGNMETFYGPLATTESQDITLTYTADKGQGMNLIGNSWTAPIQIANFEADDFGEAAAEVWVFNTGNKNDGTPGSGSSSTAGQWNTIPINAPSLPGYEGLKVIPAMQAFEVNTESETTLHLDYDRLVRAGRENLNEPMRAPRRSAAKQIEATMRVRVSGESTHTDVYLLKDARFSDGFDNGWDGHYLSGDDRSAQLYAISEEEGKLAFLAQPEIEGTQLGFAPSKHGNEYTFSFSYDGDEEYYLNDIKLKTSTLISEEATYSFTYGDGDTNRFYISRTPIDAPQTSTGVDNTGSGEVKARKFIYRDKMYIMINGRVYSADGALVK